MDPPVVGEDKRFCSVCGAPVGRTRDGRPGRSKGFCPKCRTPFDFEPRLAPGALVGGQYEVVGCLAHGGMGWIYLARDRNVNDRWVVLKGLLNTGDPDASRAAAAEKQYLAEVEHPLIVEIYNFVAASDGAFYIVMEYVGGRSLNNILKDRMAANRGLFSAIPVDQAIAYLVEILPAFSYLHSLGLLYCDFKPANMIQVGDGLKLIDLGGVRRADDDMSPIYGTVGFQAPEVPRDGCSVASDVYTVARTLAVLIFEFKGYQTKYLDDAARAPTRSPMFAEHDSLYRWLLKGTAPRPEDRFQSADEMRDQLRRRAARRHRAGHRRGHPEHAVAPVRDAGGGRRGAVVERSATARSHRRRPDGAVPGQRHGHRARGADAGLRPGAGAVDRRARRPGVHRARAASAGHGSGGRRADPHG